MSIFRLQDLPCPTCGADVAFQLVHSVNADRRPDLRDAILANRFQIGTCPACAAEFRPEPELNYLDQGRNLWVAAWPRDRMADWQGRVEQSRSVFDEAFGPAAPAGARALAASMQWRATFGWPALREKVLIAGSGLDDLGIELTKMALMRSVPGQPLDGAELRLLEIRADELLFGWVAIDSGRALQLNHVPRSLVGEIETDDAWNDLRQQLRASPFLDVRRLFLPQTA